MRYIKQISFVLILVIASFLTSKAQLSSTHYLPPLMLSSSAGVIQGQTIFLSTPETTPFDVNIYQGTSTTPISTLSISNTASGVYTPPGGNDNNNSTTITKANAGIVVSVAGLRFDAPSGKQFYLNWRATSGNQGTSLVSLGKAALGTHFKWGGIPQDLTNTNTLSNSVIGIMATEDNTIIKIKDYNPNTTFSRGVTGTTLNKAGITDDSLTINLNAGQTYTLECAPAAAASVNYYGWLGADISSNKNIVVNQGHLNITLSGPTNDQSMTQLAPIAVLGNAYVIVRGNGVEASEFPVVIATKDNTSIYLNNEVTPFTTLNTGQWIKVPSTKYTESPTTAGQKNMYIRGTENFYVFQALSSTTDPATADVFQIAPLNCFLETGVNLIPDILKNGFSNLSTAAIILTASSAITTNNIIVKYGAGLNNTVTTAYLNSIKKAVRGTSDWVTYYINPTPSISGDVSIQTNGPVAVSYLGVSGYIGVGGYFSGFGTVPTISTINQNICLNTTATSLVSSMINASYSYQWYENNTAVNTGGTIISGATLNTFTPPTTISGTKYYYVVVTNQVGCSVNSNASGAITVSQNTITLSSAASTNAQSLCKNNSITNITYATTGATNATVTGLPAGVTSAWLNNVLTISGTPTVTGTFSYTVSTIGGCSTVTASGTITVTNNNVTISSSAGSNGICAGSLVTFTASLCNGTASTTYQWFKNGTAVTGANSATYSTTSLNNGDQVYLQVGSRVTNSISQSNLILNLDAGNTSSYSGSGNVWNDLSSIQNNMEFYTTTSYLTNSNPEFSIDGGGSLRLNNVSGKSILNTGITGAGPRTMSAWVNLDDLGPNPQMNIAWIGTYATTHAFEMMQFYSKTVLLHYANGSNAGIADVIPNQWNYLTVSNDGSTSKIYINGILDASFPGTVLSTDNTPLYIGSYLPWGNLKGKMASLDMYNVALTDQAVLDNYNSTKGRFDVSNSITSNILTTNIVGSSTISLTSSAGTNSQTVCLNDVIAPITYTASGASSATITGLPSGVNGVWANNVLTISGTPTVSGNYTYTATFSSTGCASSNVTGTINILAGSSPIYTLSLNGEPCVGQAVLTATSGFNSYTWEKDNATINGATSNSYTPTSKGLYKVSVSNGICVSTSSVTVIYDCGLTAEGKMKPTTSTSLVSLNGSTNNGTGLQEVGKILSISNTYSVNIIETPVNGGRLLLNLDAKNYNSLSHTTNPGTWKDLSVNHNDAPIYGSPVYSTNNGGGLNFAGGNANYIQANNANYFSNNSFTIQAWVYPTTLNDWSPIIDFGNGENSNNIILSNTFGTSGRPGLNIEGSTLQANATVSLNAWHFISASFDISNNTATLYIDGQPSGSATMNIPTNILRTKCYIGKSNMISTPKPNFIGGIGAIQIYQGYLNAAEILTNYNNTKSLYGL